MQQEINDYRLVKRLQVTGEYLRDVLVELDETTKLTQTITHRLERRRTLRRPDLELMAGHHEIHFDVMPVHEESHLRVARHDADSRIANLNRELNRFVRCFAENLAPYAGERGDGTVDKLIHAVEEHAAGHLPRPEGLDGALHELAIHINQKL